MYWFGAGKWADLELVEEVGGGAWQAQRSSEAYASDWVPLWAGCAHPDSVQARILSLIRLGIMLRFLHHASNASAKHTAPYMLALLT